MKSLTQPRNERGSIILACMMILALALALAACNRDEGKMRQSVLSASPNGTPTASPATQTAEARPHKPRSDEPNQLSESKLPYELVPLMKALETGRLSGIAANSLSIGQMVHQNTMRKFIDDLEAKRRQHAPDALMRETLDVLLREAREVRSVAMSQLIVFDRKSGNIVVISKAYTDLLESWFNSYGVVLPSTHWGYTPPFAREATEADWQSVLDARVLTGRWAGAYMLGGSNILLPGVLALDQLSNSSVTKYEGSHNVNPSFEAQEVSAIRAKAKAAGVGEIYIIVGNSEEPFLAEVDKLILWNRAAEQTYGSIDAVRKTGKAGSIEPSVNWKDPFGELLRSVGIKEGFVQSKLYEIWRPKFVKPGRGEGNHRALIYEHWTGDQVGRVMALKIR